MKFSCSSTKSLSIVLSEFVILCIGSLFYKDTVYSATKCVGFSALFCMIISLCAIYNLNRKVDFLFLFVFFSYMFSFGQSILVFWGYDLSQTSAFSIVNGYFSGKEIFISSMFALISMIFLIVGICLVKHKKINELETKASFIGEKKLLRIGWWLIIIALCPQFYVLYIDITKTFSTGYGSTLQNYSGLAKICSIVGGLLVSGMLIVFAFETKKVRRLLLYLIMCGYIVLQLAGGTRGVVFQLFVTIFVTWNLYFKTITRKIAVWLVIAFFVGVFLFSLISATRIYYSNDANTIEIIKTMSKQLLENNFLFKSMAEMGNTQLINTLVYRCCPKEQQFQFGMTYVRMLCAIFPNFVGKLYKGYIGVDITFSKMYTRTEAGLGASFISEGYWNFGFFAFPFFTLFGLFLGKINRLFGMLCNSINRYKATDFFLLIYLMFSLTFLVRGEFNGFARGLVYYSVFPIILSKVCIRK